MPNVTVITVNNKMTSSTKQKTVIIVVYNLRAWQMSQFKRFD